MSEDVTSVDYWRGRALRAEGWTSAAEHDAVECGDEPFVLIDCRTIVGNTPLFWMPNGNGYGSVVNEIGRYPVEDAYRKRETDFPVPLRIAVKCARPRIDIQLLNRELAAAGRETPKMGWGHPPRCADCEKKAKIRRAR